MATLNGRVHDAASRQAVLSTQSPISRIAPVSSATGMNTAGEMLPRSGCFQRSKASKPVMAWLRISSWG